MSDGIRQESSAGPLRWRLSMSSTLSICFGSLIAVSLLVVLGITVSGGARNTFDLLRREAELGISLIAREIDAHLSSARIQTEFVARVLETGRIDVHDTPGLEALLIGAMAGDPAIGGVVFVHPDGRTVVVDRLDNPVRVNWPGLGKDPDILEALAHARSNGGPRWVPPVWRPDYDRTILMLQRPLWRGGGFMGILVSAISTRGLSERLRDGTEDLSSTVFTLLGEDRVLAHSLLSSSDFPGLSKDNPLPALASFPDPVLANMWDPETRRPTAIPLEVPLRGHTVTVGDDDVVFVYREITGYTEQPLLAGAYFRTGYISDEVDRILNSILAGLAAVLVSLAVAIVVGRRLARPIRRLSSAAQDVGRMNLDDIADLPPSHVIELDHQSQAFNAMRGALKWFQAYVPRPLVSQIVRHGDMSGLESERRNVTVMFTDIVGYSTASEGMSARETTQFLNHHFSILTEEIEACEGTVDKFIGDSVMAFWGAPEKQKNRAVHACSAALAIRRRVEEDNRLRRDASLAPVRMRIGIHSGEATAANIGSRERLNYTVIGDTVNVAQRLEQLGRKVAPDAEVAIVISAETARDTGNAFTTEPAGEMAVRGRSALVEVYALVCEA